MALAMLIKVIGLIPSKCMVW